MGIYPEGCWELFFGDESKTEYTITSLNTIQAKSYFSAFLRCLSNTKKLTDYFFSKNFEYDENKKFSKGYYEIISNKSFSPYSFYKVLYKENLLIRNAHKNSKELINFLLDHMHQELNKVNKNNNYNNEIYPDLKNESSMLKFYLEYFKENFNSPISNLFYGILGTKNECHGCKFNSYNFQHFNCLEFPLEQVNKYYYDKKKKPRILENGENPDIDIYELFEYLQRNNQLDDEKKVGCSVCKNVCDTNFSVNLYSGPRYLIINLNRGKENNYQCKVNYPEQLNLYDYIAYKEGITLYELYGVICQLPNEIDGHFIAFCKNINNQKWYLYDNSKEILCNKDQQYLDGIPYMLFYKEAVGDT